VLHVELLPEIDELLRNAFDKFRRRNACFRRGLLDFLTVLVNTGQEENFVALEALISSNHIGQHFLVSVSDMRWRIGVINRRGDEKRLRHSVKLPDECLEGKRLACRWHRHLADGTWAGKPMPLSRAASTKPALSSRRPFLLSSCTRVCR